MSIIKLYGSEKKEPKLLIDLCIQKIFSYSGYCYFNKIITQKWLNEYKNVFRNLRTYDGQLWHLRGTDLLFYITRYQYIYYNLLRNMEYLKDAVVDIAEALFKTPWTLLKIWIEQYALILMDALEEETLNNLVRVREHFLKAMQKKKTQETEVDGSIYLEEQEIPTSQLKSLWRECLGVD